MTIIEDAHMLCEVIDHCGEVVGAYRLQRLIGILKHKDGIPFEFEFVQ